MTHRGFTALMLATDAGLYRMAQYLISRAADVNAANTKGETATHMAVKIAENEILKLLALSGADLDQKVRAIDRT